MKTKTITQLRSVIDALDENIIHLIAQRLSIGKKIGAFKHKNSISIDDQQRERQVVDRILATAKRRGIPSLFIKKLFAEIIKETKNKQQQSPANKPSGLRIAIIGLGLIGGSLGLLIARKTNHKVIGFSKSAATKTHAAKIGAVHTVAETIGDAVKTADIVIFATPVEQTLKLLPHIAEHLKPNTLVTDTGSVKEVVCTQAEKVLPNPSLFIGGHPMAGTENSGITHADAGIFDNAVWIATPTQTTNIKALKKLSTVLADLGFQVVLMSPEKHDRAVAVVSHLPAFIALSLMQTLSNANSKEISSVASSGFADTTRLALQNPKLAFEFARFNTEELLRALASHRGTITQIESLITNEKFDELLQLLQEVQKKRFVLY